MIKNIFITGMPGTGKSTILKDIMSKYEDKIGFVTNEIRIAGERKGFEIETSNGFKEILAHVSFKTPFKVSKYFVKSENLDLAISKIPDFGKDSILYIDEIGQMELFSDNFKKLVEEYLNSENLFVATVSKVYRDNFIENLLKRKDIFLVEIDKENRSSKKLFIEMLIKKIKKAQNYIKEKERFQISENKAKMNSTHAERNLIFSNGSWKCDCDFFRSYGICSHSIAINEITSKKAV